MLIFNSYVELPEGTSSEQIVITQKAFIFLLGPLSLARGERAYQPYMHTYIYGIYKDTPEQS